ncbi:transcriptional regulator, TetR family [Actinopolyspora xinjiangensis]|uniref:Transcriptional regulator, TetR family n=1 Tax=Actinopolyspora xinjiangensis TaxID=405564 RepID=A0A1H0RQ82_9ACTN|nr:ScbR family autoregulator-binding transcription factor [Actinopolyspora xinjiangensis]SDP31623.1 transcriptional regulator, TetR family [Actinopolyspora xinjiangensis]
MTRQERAERTRELVVRAAAEVVERDGVREATLTRIVVAAGVSRGALYFHFDSKEQLADAVYESGIERLGRVVMEHYRRYRSALDTLVLLYATLARALRHDVIARAMVRLTRETDVTSRFSIDPYREWWRVVYRLLVRARRQREVPADMDLEAEAVLLVSAGAGVEVLARRDPAWWDEGGVDRVRHMLLHVRQRTARTAESSVGTPPQWCAAGVSDDSVLESTVRLD